MEKYFNVAGPCQVDEHYMLPAQERCQGLIRLIKQKQYFVIHAARQSGKTTLLLDLEQQLNASGRYYALYCSLESAHRISEAAQGIPAVIHELGSAIRFHPTLSNYPFAENINYSAFNVLLKDSLAYLCQKLDKPLVVLFDEVDCLSNGTLINFLRQLRSGYVTRGRIPFVQSIALVGMRNIRDEQQSLGSASPFNIVRTALTLRNFTLEEVTRLYAQHSAATGQEFPEEIVERIYHYTQGQPWLTNAIAAEIVEKILDYDYKQPVKLEHVEHAKETIILRRDTHIDSLLKRLKEERVQQVVEPLLLGDEKGFSYFDDDYQYTLDLGLLREVDKRLAPANPIYGEVILRVLSYASQMKMNQLQYPPYAPAYLVEGKLDMRRLLGDFQQFWRENSEIWIERYQYKEAAPHLILQAFLQRVLNGGGSIGREFAAGTKRMDLCVYYQGHAYPIELKLRYGERSYEDGKVQLAEYMDKLGCDEGWLIVFDRRKSVSWEEKIFWQTHKIDRKTIHIVGA